jgi:hypothetical protein
VQPKIVITKTNSDRTLWEAAAYFLQGLIGVRCARQIPRNNHRIWSEANDPSSQSLQYPVLRRRKQVEIGSKQNLHGTVSCPRNSMCFVAIKMGRRQGQMYRRAAYRHLGK